MKKNFPGILAFLVLFSLLLFGRTSISQFRPGQLQKAPKTLLIFEKKPCFGFCPVYKAEFLNTGEVKVTYTKPFKAAQTTTFRLSKDQVAGLQKRGEDLGFFQMKDRYETLITDFQVRELTLTDKTNQPKKVSYTEGASREFELYLIDLADLVERNLNVSFEPEEK